MIVQNARDEFDWSLETELAAPPQLAIAVYRNGRDEIVIRQQDEGFEDGDTLILVSAINGEAVANAILAVAREIKGSPTAAKPQGGSQVAAVPLLALGAERQAAE